MIYRELHIGRWVVDFYFADDEYDVEAILDVMYDMELSYHSMMQAKHLMESGSYDTGFMFADPSKFAAVIVVGPSSSGKQFVNTLVHEVHHLAVAIADNLGVDLESETPAYISGDTVLELADVICSFGCEECNP